MMATPATAPIAIPALAPPLRPEDEVVVGEGRAGAAAVGAVVVEADVNGAAVVDEDEDVDVDVWVSLLAKIWPLLGSTW